MPITPQQFTRTLATIILDIVYGVHIESLEDEYLKLAVETFGAFSDSRAAPFLYWVEYMPFLRHVPAWVPGASAVKFGARWYPRIQEMINKPFDTIKQQLHETVSRMTTCIKGLLIIYNYVSSRLQIHLWRQSLS